MSNVTRKQELQEQMSQQMTNNLSELERETSKLKVERDMTRAEVETLCSGKRYVEPSLKREDFTHPLAARAPSPRARRPAL
jgi:cell division protein FtsB